MSVTKELIEQERQMVQEGRYGWPHPHPLSRERGENL